MKTATGLKGLALLIALSAPIYSYGFDDLIADTENVLNNDQINVGGSYQRRNTESQKLERMRKKLERQNADMVSKKIENIRVNSERKLTKDLQSAFQGGPFGSGNNLEAGTSAQTSVAKVAKPEEAPSAHKSNSITPRFGVQQYFGGGVDGFESNMNVGIDVESEMTKNISMGLSVDYSTLDFVDDSGSYSNYNNYYNSYGYNFSYDEDEIRYKALTLGLFGKFYFTKGSKIRPYVGAGLSYTRSSVTYTQRSNRNTNIGSYGSQFSDSNDSVNGSNVGGSVNLGTQIEFTKTIGMMVDFKYVKSFTSGYSSSNERSSYAYQNYDQTILKSFGRDLEEATTASISAGVVIKF